MIPFDYQTPDSIEMLDDSLDHQQVMALGGGTTLLDLMKLNVLTPERVVYVKPLLHDQVRREGDRLVIGAGCTMAKLADSDPVVDRCPAIRQSLILAASPQIRNMATIGGNLLQRTRSTYFRHPEMPDDAQVKSDSDEFGAGADVSYLAALGNDDRLVGTYPGDFAVTLVAFGGQVTLAGQDGERTVPAREFYQTPRDPQTQYTTQLKPGELITKISFPLEGAASDLLKQSMYLKIRERSSYAFALASVAAGLVLEGNGPSSEQTIRHARIGLGGLASIPWHSPEAEEALIGKPASDDTFRAAAEAALAEAKPPQGTEYKVRLAKRAIVRALQILRDDGPPSDERLWAMQHGRA